VVAVKIGVTLPAVIAKQKTLPLREQEAFLTETMSEFEVKRSGWVSEWLNLKKDLEASKHVNDESVDEMLNENLSETGSKIQEKVLTAKATIFKSDHLETNIQKLQRLIQNADAVIIYCKKESRRVSSLVRDNDGDKITERTVNAMKAWLKLDNESLDAFTGLCDSMLQAEAFDNNWVNRINGMDLPKTEKSALIQLFGLGHFSADSVAEMGREKVRSAISAIRDSASFFSRRPDDDVARNKAIPLQRDNFMERPEPTFQNNDAVKPAMDQAFDQMAQDILSM
jgi:hypothetical protein